MTKNQLLIWRLDVAFLLLLALVGVGCQSTLHHKGSGATDLGSNEPAGRSIPEKGQTNAPPPIGWHTILHQPDSNKPAIRAIEKFNLVWWFGNRDQSDPPADYRPHDKSRLPKWRARNPFHNFTYYVVGIADKEVKRSGCHPEQNFLPGGGWNFAVSRYKWCPRPFVSWCRGTKGLHFYCGWRTAGNFGFKCNIE